MINDLVLWPTCGMLFQADRFSIAVNLRVLLDALILVFLDILEMLGFISSNNTNKYRNAKKVSKYSRFMNGFAHGSKFFELFL